MSARGSVGVFVCCVFPALREACVQWLDAEPDIDVTAAVSTTAEFDFSSGSSDVAVIDGDPDDPAVHDEVARIERAWPDAKVLLYSRLPEPELADATGDATAAPDGYLPRDADAARLIAAVRHLAEAP